MISAIGMTQTPQEQVDDESSKAVVYDIIQLSKAKNVSEIDKKYIHPEYGVYDVFIIGVPDNFEHHSSLAFALPTGNNDSVYPNLLEISNTIMLPELKSYNAKYDCNEMVWDCEGFFVTDSIYYPKLSAVIKQPVFETSKFPESLHTQAKHIEENSYRIVVTEFDIIFYLTKIDKRRYLTLFDRVTTDCSA